MSLQLTNTAQSLQIDGTLSMEMYVNKYDNVIALMRKSH